MKKYLSGGVEADIVRNATGGLDVILIFPPKTYYSHEEGMQDKYNKISAALIDLKAEIPELGGGVNVGDTDLVKKSQQNQSNLPDIQLQRVEGLDGQIKWVRTPPPKKPKTTAQKPQKHKTAPHKKRITPKTSTAPHQPIQGNSPAPYKFIPPSVNQQSSTYVAQGPHPEMLKPGENLSDLQLADMLFPANNENVKVSFGVDAGTKEIKPPVHDWELNKPPEEQNPNVIEESQQKTGFDIGLLAYKNTITDKTILQKYHYTDPQTGIDEVGEYMTTLREETTYKAAGPEKGRGVIETRDVYILGYTNNGYDVYNKLVVSQYRIGVEIPVTPPIPGVKQLKKIANKGGADFDIGFTISFDSPWIDNPIPKHIDKEPPTIERGDY